MTLPARFTDLQHLEDVMSEPSPALIDDLARIDGDIMVLGVGGKMGPTLARMAKRAAPGKRVIGVARFSQAGLREALVAHGIECIEADLLSRDALASLPDAANIIYMAGRKFGSTGSEWLTWAMNAHVPALVAERFARSCIVAFSTACVYPFVSTAGDGAKEYVPPTAPSGEYANSCVARERMFEHFSHASGTPGRLIRLSYAIDMRYGVLHDVAQKVLNRQPIDLAMGHANIIWQGEANDWTLRCLAHCTAPTSALNMSGPKVSIRAVAKALGERLGIAPVLQGEEAPTAWLIDSSEAYRLFGPPAVSLATMLDWTADWMRRGGESLGKPTHYEARDGKY
ncbi:NAD(P)-dependent oxidoreductase [Caenimonas koreensis]|uniref:NAD-dependent epimerase/dehydratase family protein n=1 Tax=Caenimonas koreensis DSM 17982 TaxID=1121255 RepID=A0A844BBZ9_9BURK|nr:NAD-dependent epimerase/dehydratase family protein [Caenimonas koreensis]MRD49096.1 NAD-dependent epimerase/dehydratase family protein [Caenimonas koreensis DSM 17982]